MEAFQLRIVASAKKVATRSGEKDALPLNFKRRIKDTFVDTLCFVFDGILSSATVDPDLTGGRRPTRISTNQFQFIKDIVSQNPAKSLIQLQDTRLLITMAKFNLLRSKSLPILLSKTARLLDLDMSKDEALLIEVLDNMDEMIFSDYVKRRLVLLVEVIQGGILNSGVDWLNTPKPTGESEPKPLKNNRLINALEVRPYMHRLVLILVESHSKVGDVSPALVSRVLQGLIEGVTEEALKCFQRIPKYGTGGMLTVSLQIQLEHRAEVYRPRSRLNSSTKALAST